MLITILIFMDGEGLGGGFCIIIIIKTDRIETTLITFNKKGNSIKKR